MPSGADAGALHPVPQKGARGKCHVRSSRPVPLTQIPTAFLYLGCWFLMAGVVYYFFGLETKGKSLEQIDRELAAAD